MNTIDWSGILARANARQPLFDTGSFHSRDFMELMILLRKRYMDESLKMLSDMRYSELDQALANWDPSHLAELSDRVESYRTEYCRLTPLYAQDYRHGEITYEEFEQNVASVEDWVSRMDRIAEALKRSRQARETRTFDVCEDDW